MSGKSQTYVFATLFSFFLLGVFVLLRPEPTQAQFQLFPGENPAGDFRNYVLSFYTFSIAAGTLIATVLIMIGGMIWVTSAGNPSRIELAKSYIIDSIIGVVLLMSAVVLLRLINPALVELPKITPASLVGPPGACIYQDPSVKDDRVSGNRNANYQRCQTVVEIICQKSLNEGTWKSGKTCEEVCPEKAGGRPGECVEPESNTYTGKPLQKSSANCPSNKPSLSASSSENLMLDTCNTYCNPGNLQPYEPGFCQGGISDIVRTPDNKYTYNCTCRALR